MMTEIMIENGQVKDALKQAQQEVQALRLESAKNQQAVSLNSQERAASLEELKRHQEELANCRENMQQRDEEVKQLGISNDKIIEELNSFRIK